MAEISSKQIEQLQQSFASPERLNDGALLAGGALALPLLGLRRRQANLEARRTEIRLGPDHEETKARRQQAQGLALRESDLQTEVARQRLIKPATGEQAGLYGRITRKGEPVPGVAVAALDEAGTSLAHSCTGHDGGYVLSFAPDKPILIEVRDGKSRLFRDETGTAYPPYRAVHRDIELSKAKPPCPGDEPAEPGERVIVPNLIGMKEEEALRTIEALALKPGKRSTRRDRQAGLILDHDPPPGAATKAGGSIDYVVSTAEQTPASRLPDLTGRSLSQAVEEIRKAEATLGAVNVAVGGSRTPSVRAARADDKGQTIDLDVVAVGGEAQLMGIVATVLPATAEGAAIGLTSAATALEWLKARRLDSLEQMNEAQALDDAKLRKRVGLKPDEAVAPVRGLIQAGVSRVRRV
ncbi:PASTA domain-containing protein [Sphingosinicella terrae]|uniref:PASTA domain-containing protein n=1 Tax=Sphingosinicella terrae TaxID=2172047 RepID=UPI0013B3DCD4|nr:PASTA domain-containing protein [Sphingosinicella terrae]